MKTKPIQSPRGMNHAQVEASRHHKGNSILLFITDRCPVACSHCSVDSRADSPTISDFELFEQLVNGICSKKSIEVVGISGGEPFSERRGLSMACSKISHSGKRLVIYTSGVWAKSEQTPAWIQSVLNASNTIYLSTDSFHQATVKPLHFMRAAQAIARTGAWIVVQTLEPEQAQNMLCEALGDLYTDYAEVVPIFPLTNGRGKEVFIQMQTTRGHSFGSCSLAVTPVVRYDGVVTGCCNESVIMGKGPPRLRRETATRQALDVALHEFETDPLLRSVAGVGLGPLTQHPSLQELSNQLFANNCDLCWKVMEHFPNPVVQDRLIHAIAELEQPT